MPEAAIRRPNPGRRALSEHDDGGRRDERQHDERVGHAPLRCGLQHPLGAPPSDTSAR